MSERDDKQAPETQQPVGGPVLYILAAAFAAIAGFGSVTLGDFFSRRAADESAPTTQNTGGNLSAASTQDGKGGLGKLVHAESPRPMPDVSFTDDAGQTRSLADWKGKVVLVNLWATWCAPCKVEMPSLSRLQSQLGGDDFAVVPVSLDRTGPDAPRKFLASNNLGNLPLLIDASASFGNKIGAGGLPATLILDREGREIARLVGPAEWDSPAAQDVIRAAIAGKLKP
jgi:thiol-disulfide isomerase/thioredoxin